MPRSTPRRTAMACTRCRRLKVKCVMSSPDASCSKCLREKRNCEYVPVAEQMGIPESISSRTKANGRLTSRKPSPSIPTAPVRDPVRASSCSSDGSASACFYPVTPPPCLECQNLLMRGGGTRRCLSCSERANRSKPYGSSPLLSPNPPRTASHLEPHQDCSNDTFIWDQDFPALEPDIPMSHRVTNFHGALNLEDFQNFTLPQAPPMPSTSFSMTTLRPRQAQPPWNTQYYDSSLYGVNNEQPAMFSDQRSYPPYTY